MGLSFRIILSLGIILLHFVGFFLPLTEFFLIYILLFNPRWFRNFLNNLDKKPEAEKV
jgi:hypothetical protein